MNDSDGSRPLNSDSTIERDLFRFLGRPPAAHSTGDSFCSRSAGSAGELEDPAKALAVALNHLLWEYVDLVDAAEHGGWSRDEDEMVRSVVAALERAGAPVRR